jgi:hypothetical protein
MPARPIRHHWPIQDKSNIFVGPAFWRALYLVHIYNLKLNLTSYLKLEPY